MPVAIRDAREKDVGELAQLVTALGYPTQAGQVQMRLKKMPRRFYRTLVATDGTHVVGFIGLLTLPVYEHDGPVGWILALSVAEDQRGRGIGRALVAAAERHYRSRGAIDVRLHSGLQRDRAHDFYGKMGFNKSGYRFKKRLS